MKIAIFHATREGQTRRIAEHVAALLTTRRVEVDLIDVRRLAAPVVWSPYATAILAASVHLGRHEPEMVAFVKRNRSDLERIHAVFVSVRLSEAGAEDPNAAPDRRGQAAADVRQMLDTFVRQTGWQPADVKPVAGALVYSRYNFLVRFVMKRIARKAGASTDTSRDHELTDWVGLPRFIEKCVGVGADAAP